VVLEGHGVREVSGYVHLPHEQKMLAPHPLGGQAHHRAYSYLGHELVSQGEYTKDEDHSELEA
jgi:hypothetical protein